MSLIRFVMIAGLSLLMAGVTAPVHAYKLAISQYGRVTATLPWVVAMTTRLPVTDCMLELRAANHAIRTFAVNATPVLDAHGGLRGALASFDDVTELRQQNGELQRTLTQLEESRQVVEEHIR